MTGIGLLRRRWKCIKGYRLWVIGLGGKGYRLWVIGLGGKGYRLWVIGYRL